MEKISVVLALCAGDSPVTSEFPSQRSMARSFDFVLDLGLNKRLGKQSRHRCFQTPSCPLWRHYDWKLVERSGHILTFPFFQSAHFNSLLPPYGDIDLCQHWLRWWFVALANEYEVPVVPCGNHLRTISQGMLKHLSLISVWKILISDYNCISHEPMS